MISRFLAGLLLFGFAQNGAHNQIARDIYKELIEIKTTDSDGSTTRAAEAIAARLKAAGFPEADIQVVGPHPRKGNLVARYRGTGRRGPLLLLAHLDVVEALREDWSLDPFTLAERDGHFYGRGTTDDKAMAAAWISAFIRMRQEDYKPDRDLIIALTADEEGGDYNGVQWLLKNYRDLVDADFALNEGGESLIKDGKYLLNGIQPSEKVYQSFRLEVRNAGGHSSRPVKDNAIYHLAEGLTRLAKYQFPIHLNEVTEGYFQRMSLLRTTCVATRLEGGHADNALPQTARAIVNCRLLPGESPAEVRSTLIRVLEDSRISVTPIGDATASNPSPMRADVLAAIEQLTNQMWPGVPVVPVMSTGATDGLYLRNAGIPTYGISGFFEDVDDTRAHGRDERLGVKQFYEGIEFLYRLVKALSS